MLISPDFLLRIYKENNYQTSWDIIAICASDPDQAAGYRVLGEDKFQAKLRIYSDPPGPKIGNGGALLFCLSELRNEFGIKKLSSLRTLFIPAGGMSQRSPWLAALGKLFATMPTSSAGCLDMLDIVVALSEPFGKFAADSNIGCFFLACSDALLPCEFESTNLSTPSPSCHRLAQSDVVALAHPTQDLGLASGHGIYCVDQKETIYEISPRTGLTILDCCRVLQKPTIPEMRSISGVIAAQDGSVLVDSVFWLHNVNNLLEALLAWHDENQLSMVGLELDSYGDFLRGLGSNAVLSDYANETRNLSRPPSPPTVARLIELRTSLFKLLRGRKLRLCRIDKSALVHIGSTREYLDALFRPIELARCFTVGVENGMGARHDNIVTRCTLNISERLKFNSIGSAMEFCNITARSCHIGSDCLLSHCVCNEPLADLLIPNCWVMQTIPLTGGGCVTWAFHSDDNPKQRDFKSAIFLGKPLNEFLERHGVDFNEAWIENSGSASLWSTRLFPFDRSWIGSSYVRNGKSFLTTLSALMWSDENVSTVYRLKNWLAEAPEERKLMSMAEITQAKDITTLVKFRMSFKD